MTKQSWLPFPNAHSDDGWAEKLGCSLDEARRALDSLAAKGLLERAVASCGD